MSLIWWMVSVFPLSSRGFKSDRLHDQVTLCLILRLTQTARARLPAYILRMKSTTTRPCRRPSDCYHNLLDAHGQKASPVRSLMDIRCSSRDRPRTAGRRSVQSILHPPGKLLQIPHQIVDLQQLTSLRAPRLRNPRSPFGKQV